MGSVRLPYTIDIRKTTLSMKLLTIVAALVVSLTVFAQAPQALNYQAVARDNAGAILANTNLDVRFSVKQTTATGTTVFQETHAASTDALGGFSLEIGRGAASTGSFTAINWGAGPYFLEVELDVNSSGSYTSMGTSEMLSVPYALYAETAGIADSVVNPSSSNDSYLSSMDSSWLTLDTIIRNDDNNDFILDEAEVIFDRSLSYRQEIISGTVPYRVYVNGTLVRITDITVGGINLLNQGLFRIVYRANDLTPGDIVEFVGYHQTPNGLLSHQFTFTF